ncbi:Protein Fe65 [Nymphon striatum]|nr:Protein Fe65 [Nymphon striatum]
MNNDLYAIPVKCKQFPSDSDGKISRKSPVTSDKPSPTNFTSKIIRDFSHKPPQSSFDLSLTSDLSEDGILPLGWEKHEDIDGPYFWHIKSGTIQRDPPRLSSSTSQQDMRNLPLAPVPSSLSAALSTQSLSNLAISSTHLHFSFPRFLPPLSVSLGINSNHANRQLYTLCYMIPSKYANKLIRFAVRSLGWVEIAEDDLTPDRSSKAVNKCIVDLSHGKNDKLDAVGRWGDGKDLYMDLDDHSLKLVSPIDMNVLNTQPIHTIRVWGVGRDNGSIRDFAYVARDRVTRKHMCHVFRCDTPARTIANTLRDICKKIMIERSLVQNLAKPVNTGQVKNHHKPDTKLASHSFPTPMEEPKKVLKAHYLGSEIVRKPTGMDVLNDAIDRKMASLTPDKWQFANVAVAPSTITIQEPGNALECVKPTHITFDNNDGMYNQHIEPEAPKFLVDALGFRKFDQPMFFWGLLGRVPSGIANSVDLTRIAFMEFYLILDPLNRFEKEAMSLVLKNRGTKIKLEYIFYYHQNKIQKALVALSGICWDHLLEKNRRAWNPELCCCKSANLIQNRDNWSAFQNSFNLQENQYQMSIPALRLIDGLLRSSCWSTPLLDILINYILMHASHCPEIETKWAHDKGNVQIRKKHLAIR